MVSYFISDLHLQESCSTTADLFFNFLATKAMHADAVYILGDFFELWCGDDYTSPFITKVTSALANLAANNVKVFLMHGNRDFLLSAKFAAQAKCTLLPDPCLINIYGTNWLLSHGDMFIKDPAYKIFRSITRSALFKFFFLLLPLSLRLKLADKMRSQSKINYKKLVINNPNALDVSETLIAKTMQLYNTYKLIHGHTHIPAIHSEPSRQHSHSLKCSGYTRIVLGSWSTTSQILTHTPDGYNLETIGC